MEKTLVFTATYNEVDNIKPLVGEILRELPNTDILIVDDNSPDGTGVLLDEMVEENSQLKAIHRKGKLGLGSAHVLAFKYAVEKGYDILITMDADFSHNPKYLPQIVSKMKTNDYVTGSRHMKGGKCDYGFIRQAFSKTANWLTRMLLGLKLKENTTSYRGFSLDLLKRMPIEKIQSNGYSFFFEISYLVCRLTKKFEEIPIHFEHRRAGSSKISQAEIYKGIAALIKLFFRRFSPSRIHSQI